MFCGCCPTPCCGSCSGCSHRTLYRIRVLGRDNIPDKGGALFVCNHVSFVDALLLLASTDRQVRFMMFKDFTSCRG
jgi:1-acyl-sn-glycerol-3-phosphate acyltransferase